MTDAEVEAVARLIDPLAFESPGYVKERGYEQATLEEYVKVLTLRRKRACSMARKCIAALDAARAAAGMVVVPREPTEAMCEAGYSLQRNNMAHATAARIWRAMIAAATLPAPGASE